MLKRFKNKLINKYFILHIHILFVILITPLKSHSQFPPIINLADTTADVTIYGAYDLYKTGWKFTSGDINGDGTEDLIISSHGASPLGRQGAGITEILWGSASFDSIIDLNIPTNNISRIYGITEYVGTFASLTCGDYNNDGFDDIAIGMFWKPPYVDNPGTAFIVFGCDDFPDTLDLETPIRPTTRIYGEPGFNGCLGFSNCSGDVNGDGYDDVIIAAPNYTPNGEIYIIYGKDSFPQSIWTGNEIANCTRIICADVREGAGFGFGSLACGDVDNDGYDEVLIGAPGNSINFSAGNARLLYGASIMPDTIYFTNPSSRMITFLPEPEFNESHLGDYVSIGDVNGDGYGDIVLTARGASPLGCSVCGEVYVIYGSNNLPESITMNEDTLAITRLIGEGDRGGYGENVLVADLTDDGYAEIITLKGCDEDPQTNKDVVIVFYGSAEVPDSVFLGSDTTLSKFIGRVNEGHFGDALGVGDYNNDSFADLAIGAYRADPLGRNSAGKAYLFYGIDIVSNANNHFIPQFVLKQNFPNPFSRSTTINYILSKPSPVSIAIYNVLGQRITKFTKPFEPAGPHSITWDGLNDRGVPVSSGVYLYRLKVGGLSQTLKMIRLR